MITFDFIKCLDLLLILLNAILLFIAKKSSEHSAPSRTHSGLSDAHNPTPGTQVQTAIQVTYEIL